MNKKSNTIILAIETSCDETAISIIEATDQGPEVRAHVVHSQIDLHKEYGGVFPSLAKREHGKNLPPVLIEALEQAGLFNTQAHAPVPEEIQAVMTKNPDLVESFSASIPTISRPSIDYIAVTRGPGLEPALWAGITFAEALGALWNIPVIPVNHMEGHIASVLLGKTEAQNPKSETLNPKIEFPMLAFLISGGHTELIRATDWGSYTILGQTLDDAIGEAFDKTARLLGLPYPGGPAISELARKHRETHAESTRFSLPRPMLHSEDLNFSFSGLKTAVRYALEKEQDITPEIQATMALEFEDAVTEVCTNKLRKALTEYPADTCILAGGVSANTHLRETLGAMVASEFPQTTFIVPEMHLSTDNATMIGLAAYQSIIDGREKTVPSGMKASGTLRLDEQV